MPFSCPIHSHPLWYLEVQASSPTPTLLLVGDERSGPREVEESSS